jgi:hypothetical protein
MGTLTALGETYLAVAATNLALSFVDTSMVVRYTPAVLQPYINIITKSINDTAVVVLAQNT